MSELDRLHDELRRERITVRLFATRADDRCSVLGDSDGALGELICPFERCSMRQLRAVVLNEGGRVVHARLACDRGAVATSGRGSA